MRAKRIFSSLWLCVFVFSLPSLAQVTTGTISGVVVDSSGAVIPGAKLKVTNLETGISREAVTDGAGRYRIGQLSLGNYSAQAQIAGFQAQEKTQDYPDGGQ